VRGLAEQLGAVDRKGRGFALDRLRDVGIDVTGYIESDNKECIGRVECSKVNPLMKSERGGQGGCGRLHEDRDCVKDKFPSCHRYFQDCYREMSARKIEWMMSMSGVDSWFVTLTFKEYIHENRARQLVKSWIYSLNDGYKAHVLKDIGKGVRGLKWVVAQEWQKRHVIHFHILISGVRLGILSRKRWECRWMAMSYEVAGTVLSPCGFARIYDARKKAAPYLAKYVGKTNDAGDELEWGGSWQGIAVPDSVRCCKA